MASSGAAFEAVGVPMRRPRPLPVKLFCGLIGKEAHLDRALPYLEQEFGRVEFGTAPACFDFTDY